MVTVSFVPAGAMAGDDTPVARVEMKDLFDSIKNSDQPGTAPLTGVSVTVEAVRQQTDVEKGLQLSVIIRNNATQSLVMEDPADFIQIQLLNVKGYPVALPATPPRRFLCMRSNESDLRPGSGEPPSELESRRAFDLVRPKAQPAKSSDQLPLSEPRLEVGRLTLPPAKEYRLELRILRILADPVGYLDAQEERARMRSDSQSPPAPLPPTIAIPSGRYSAKVQIALVPAGGDAGSRHLASEPVPIDLKPQNAPK